MKFLLGVFAGACTAVLATLIHAWIFPAGIIIAISGSVAVSFLLGQYFGSRILKVGFAFGWLGLIVRAATFGNSDELLISNNPAGNLLLTLGFFAVLIGIGARV